MNMSNPSSPKPRLLNKEFDLIGNCASVHFGRTGVVTCGSNFVAWETSAQANWAVTKTPGDLLSIGEDITHFTHFYTDYFPSHYKNTY